MLTSSTALYYDSQRFHLGDKVIQSDATGPPPKMSPGRVVDNASRRMRPAVRALKHRNFRLLWAGQWARATGLWMQLVATPLLLLSIGGSAVDLGIVYALQFGPILLLAPVGGAIADRVDRRALLMGLQGVTAAQALLMVVVITSGSVASWQIFALAAVLGVVNAAEMPTRISLVGELVPDEDLPNAVALMMVAMNASRIIGPAIAGLLVATIGYEANFIWSFSGATLAVVLVRLIDGERTIGQTTAAEESVWRSILGAVAYIWRTPLVRTGLGLLAVFGVFGISFQTILPLYAIDMLGLDPAGYGFIVAAMGVGALSAALPITMLGTRTAGRLMFIAPVVFACLLASLALTTVPEVAFALIVPLGFFFVMTNAVINVTVQGTIAHQFRGRTMGIYVSIMHGGGALGALIMGLLASMFSVPVAMSVGAGMTAALALILLGVRPR